VTARWLIDTCVLIDHLRGVPAARALLETGADDDVELWSVTVVRTEVLAGMRPSEAGPTHKLLDQLRWSDVTRDLADRAGELARRYLRSHRAIDTIDYLVAAAALGVPAELKTTNVRHYPMIAGLSSAY
jgi:predicted nucleic acid-binding protein